MVQPFGEVKLGFTVLFVPLVIVYSLAYILFRKRHLFILFCQWRRWRERCMLIVPQVTTLGVGRQARRC